MATKKPLANYAGTVQELVTGDTIPGTSISNTPSGNIAAVTVQAALNELDTEKAALSGVETQAFSTSTITSKSTSDVAVLGTELTTNGTFTGAATNWTLGTNWAYGTDNVILTLDGAAEGTLSQNISVTSGESYLIEWSQTNSVANNGTLKPSIGAVNGIAVCPTELVAATMSQVIVAGATGSLALTFTPIDVTSTGTITVDTVTVKQVTKITATTILKDTTGVVRYEERVARSANSGNTFNGTNSGAHNTTGYSNSFMGVNAGYSNTTGYYNSFVGLNAGYSNTTGSSNSFMGVNAGYSMKPTSKAITAFSDYSGTVAGAVKATSVAHGLTGTTTKMISGTVSYNGSKSVTVIDADNFYFTATWVSTQTGWWAIDTDGRYNTAIGYQAGYTDTPANATVTASGCTFIGYNAGAGSATQNDYATAIGYLAKVTTGNTVVLGRTTDNTVIGATGDDSSGAKLQVTGDIKTTQAIRVAAPITLTSSTLTVAATTSYLICNYAGTVTLTLPTASTNTGRSIKIKTITANTVISVASNVAPIDSATAGTAILAATAGKWAELVSDGTNWIIMGAN